MARVAARVAAAMKIIRPREAMLTDTLAAAGNFEEALTTQQRAIEMAKGLGEAAFVSELEKHAESCAKKQPVVSKPASSQERAWAQSAWPLPCRTMKTRSTPSGTNRSRFGMPLGQTISTSSTRSVVPRPKCARGSLLAR